MNIQNISNLEKDYVLLSTEIGNNLRIDNLSASIIGLLQISSEPISMETLSEKTGYSLTSIFNKLKTLEHHPVSIKKIKEPGSKKVLLYMEKNIPNTIKNSLLNIHEKRILPAKERLPKIIEKYEKLKLNEQDKKSLTLIKKLNQQTNVMDKKIKKIIELFENEK